MKPKFKIALLGLMVLSLAACASPVRDLYFGEIKGMVVDADTNQPIEGAVVYVNWQAIDRHSGFIQAVDVGPLYATETTTDKEGHFVLPKGGPIKVDKLDELTPNAPTIGALKFGYKPGLSSLGNKVEYKWIIRKYFLPADPKLSNFKLHRMTLHEMQAEDNTYTTFALSDDVADIMNRSCWWEKLPRTIMALEHMENKAKEQELWLFYGITTRNKIPKDRGCKDPKEILGE
jgi:hypothetical protein